MAELHAKLESLQDSVSRSKAEQESMRQITENLRQEIQTSQSRWAETLEACRLRLRIANRSLQQCYELADSAEAASDRPR